MSLSINSLTRYFKKKSVRKKRITLYEQTKFELSFYLNEFASCKFILERQQNTPTEVKHFDKRHTELCGVCLKTIQDLVELICALSLDDTEDVEGYLKAYNRAKIVNRPSGFPYQLNSN